MNRDEILSIYDDWYADSYDERFHGGDLWNDNLGAHKIELVGELVEPGQRWLDTGCGTGVHLAAHPDVERCGLDLSPSMLDQARTANPDVEFVLGSYLDEHPDWVGSWDLVTNLWLSYQFVDSLRDVDRVVTNLASWVKPDGTLMMHVADCADVARGVDLPWLDEDTPIFSDLLYITSVTWSWRESNGREHKDLVAPQLQRMVNLFARHFSEIEVRWWPIAFEGSNRPKAVIGRQKRARSLELDEVGHSYPYRETYFASDPSPGDSPAPSDADESTPPTEPEPAPSPEADDPSEAGELSTGALLREVARRAAPGDRRVWSTIAAGASRRTRAVLGRGDDGTAPDQG